MKKYIYTVIVSLAFSSIASAVLTIRSTNLIDFDNSTSAIVDNTGDVIANSNGVVATGSFGALTDLQIQSLTSASAINAAFTTVGSTTSMNSGNGLWDISVVKAGDTSADVGKSVFTVIGNGNSIASSDQFLVYRHGNVNGTGNFNHDPNSNTDAAVAIGGGSTGSLVVGEHGNFQYDFGSGSFDAFNLVAVPEPSSTALLGLGGVALLLRRRR